ncbi:hypothetical protein Tco_0986578 [Tanacetum coccineum]
MEYSFVTLLVLMTIKRLYYCSIKSELKDGIKELKTDKDVEDFLRVGYENKWFVNLYTEHHDYDVLEFLTIEGNVNDTPFESSDEYESSDEVEEIDYVDFHTEGEENDNAMHNIAVNLEDHITPTVKKKLEYLKREQRNWTVFPSAYQLLEVRCGDSAFGVNLGEKTCACYGN